MKDFMVKVMAGIGRAFAALALVLRGLGRFVSRALVLVWRSRAVSFGWRFTKRVVRVTALAALIVGLTLTVAFVCFERVQPATIGVKQTNFGGGIVGEDFDPGLHFSLRGWHAWHSVDARTQVASFGIGPEGGEHPVLTVRTKDGNVVRVGASVPYRVRRGEAHLLVQEGLKSAYTQRVKATVEKVLLAELAALTTEAWYDTDKRLAVVAAALPRLNADLALVHIEAEAILVTQVMFGGEYEKRQQEKQLASLKTIVDQAKDAIDKEQTRIDYLTEEIDAAEKALVAELNKRVEETFARGRARIAEKQAESRFYDQTRHAQAEAEFERQVSEGEREIAKAEGLRIALENQSYGTVGGRLLLAREAAENLNIRQVTLNSNDPRVPSVLDLDELVKRLVGTLPAEKKP